MGELQIADIENAGFVIDNESKANWAIEQIKHARADRDAWVTWYNDKIKQIVEQTDFDTMNLERMLAEYFANVPHKKTKTQESYTLPSGKLVLKTQNPEYKRDDKTVIEFLKSNGQERFVKVEEKLDWAALKSESAIVGNEMVNDDGEVIPGVEVVERPAKFVVEV